jgi:hypothetical protein
LQFKASLSKQFARPYLEKPITKNWAIGVSQGEGPEFFCPVWQKKELFIILK